MGGTREGALKTAAKLKAKDPNYYQNLRKQVKKPAAGKRSANGFDKDPERARSAGAKGGAISRRRSSAVPAEAEEAQSDDGSDTVQDPQQSRAY